RGRLTFLNRGKRGAPLLRRKFSGPVAQRPPSAESQRGRRSRVFRPSALGGRIAVRFSRIASTATPPPRVPARSVPEGSMTTEDAVVGGKPLPRGDQVWPPSVERKTAAVYVVAFSAVPA